MTKLSAQLMVGSDEWHLARCNEPGKCSQDSTTNEKARDICRREACVVGRSNVLSAKLNNDLPDKTAAISKRPKL